ncbi:hypothetical protein CMI37_19920 [Candidatus Pacearchaeota archaeon]|nr:hypothetical protein [Candidatus Pacearchaeota archaeon]|tara:strand:- start:828 stop:1292 length:465 start_codon:yes stop_codon:yes gene_type:complete
MPDSLRGKILTQLKSLLEGAPGVFTSSVGVSTAIHKVFEERKSISMYSNYIEMIYPSIPAVYDSRTVGKTDEAQIPLLMNIRMRRATQDDNDDLYMIIENIRQLLWDNPTINLETSGVETVHVDADALLINENDQTIKDGADLSVMITTVKNYG